MSVQEKRTFPSRSPSPSEAVAKKICRETKSTETSSENDSSDEPTILDVLNEDCWRAIFQYVHILDLIDTERVSKKWRSMVHCYLQGIRVCLRHNEYVNWWFEHPMNSRIVYIPDYDLDDVVQKLGRSVVGAFCTYSGEIDTMADFCPDIEDLKIVRPDFDFYFFEDNRAKELKKLKRISFQVAVHFVDEDIKDFLVSPVLEEVTVNYNRALTGRCLKSLRNQLKALSMDGCKKLNVGNLVTTHHLYDLIKLGLNRNPTATLKNVYKLIERCPKLECLTFEGYEYPTQVGGLVNAICHLRRLTHLSFRDNVNVYDDWLAPIGRYCKALRYVSVGKCKNVTAAGVLALCRGAGNTLVRLDVSYNDDITDHDVASVIRACPKLERLDVPFGNRLTDGLAGVAAAALVETSPRPRLRLQLTYMGYLGPPMENTEYLKLNWGENDDPTAWDHHYFETIPNSRPEVSNFNMLYREY